MIYSSSPRRAVLSPANYFSVTSFSNIGAPSSLSESPNVPDFSDSFVPVVTDGLLFDGLSRRFVADTPCPALVGVGDREGMGPGNPMLPGVTTTFSEFPLFSVISTVPFSISGISRAWNRFSFAVDHGPCGNQRDLVSGWTLPPLPLRVLNISSDLDE